MQTIKCWLLHSLYNLNIKKEYIERLRTVAIPQSTNPSGLSDQSHEMDEGQQIYVSNLVGGKDYIPVQERRCNVYLTRLETDRTRIQK